MNKFLIELFVDFPAQAGHMDVDDIVERSVAAGFFPDVAGQHLAGDDVALVPHQILQKLELAGGKVQRLAGAGNGAADHIHFKIPDAQSRAGLRGASATQRADASQQFGKRKGLHQIVVGARYPRPRTRSSMASRAVSIRTGVLNPCWRMVAQDLRAASAGKHHVQDHQIEGFGLNQVEAFFAGVRQRPRRTARLAGPPAAPGRASVRLRSPESARISLFFIGEPEIVVH